ncbi:hypothetical protein SD961_14440 [Erwinia sp. MMLR14_017]|uniref:hypothetical protein n=1 Tax=Erwinia sp. MMLR14_017 TaxID=3093842 RepID=UPI0029903D01|nr:hypothetical protein [Erwinia sp. MMLR14_017]MDW8847069.1 hypothetical protein [Erwinia sp. MMLR14_017]
MRSRVCALERGCYLLDEAIRPLLSTWLHYFTGSGVIRSGYSLPVTALPFCYLCFQ